MKDESIRLGPSSFILHPSSFPMKTIPKITRIDATVTAPPSKSYSVRAILLAAMTEGTTTIQNCLDADDTRYAIEALRTLGFDVSGSIQREVYFGERRTM